MENVRMSAQKARQQFSGGRRVNSALEIRTLSVNEAIARQFGAWSTSFISRRLKTSERTVENWKQGRTGPQAKHVAAILADEVLCPAFLKAMGRADIADLVSARDHLLAAKAALDQIG
jgi:DNA-binding transcriptional regulator YiaG